MTPPYFMNLIVNLMNLGPHLPHAISLYPEFYNYKNKHLCFFRDIITYDHSVHNYTDKITKIARYSYGEKTGTGKPK
jgi:hypothetical protein